MKIKNLRVVLLFLFGLLPYMAWGQGQDGGPPVDAGAGITNPIVGVDNIADLVRILLEAAVKIGIPVIAIAIIYAGFLFVTAGGNTEKLDTAKKALLYSVIGTALIIGAWALAQVITETILQLD